MLHNKCCTTNISNALSDCQCFVGLSYEEETWKPVSKRIFFFISSSEPAALIKKCAEEAHARGYEYFSTQFTTECWAGDSSAANTFYLNGIADSCVDGVGREASNFVYRIGAPSGML